MAFTILHVIWLGIAGVLVLIFVAIYMPRVLSKKTTKIVTPRFTNRVALHPNGLTSRIEYYYQNHNNKTFWKFEEHDYEVAAELVDDVIVQPGAEDGKNYYVFRFNRNGDEEIWKEPVYRKYFADKKDENRKSEQRFLNEISDNDYDSYRESIEGAKASREIDKSYNEAIIDELRYKKVKKMETLEEAKKAVEEEKKAVERRDRARQERY